MFPTLTLTVYLRLKSGRNIKYIERRRNQIEKSIFRWPEKSQTSEYASVSYILTQCLYQPEYWATVLMPLRNQSLSSPSSMAFPGQHLFLIDIVIEKIHFHIWIRSILVKEKDLYSIQSHLPCESVPITDLVCHCSFFYYAFAQYKYMYIHKHIKVCLYIYIYTYTQTFFVVTNKTTQYVSLGISWFLLFFYE